MQGGRLLVSKPLFILFLVRRYTPASDTGKMGGSEEIPVASHGTLQQRLSTLSTLAMAFAILK